MADKATDDKKVETQAKDESKSETKTESKAKVTMADLKGLISETVSEAVKEYVEEAVKPLKEQVTNWGAYINTHKEPRKRSMEERGIGVARMLRAVAATKGDPERACHWLKKAYGDDDLTNSVIKALGASNFTAGGFIVPEDMRTDIIELLRPRTVVRAAGAPVVPMPRGTLTLPKQTGDITATYVGENKDISSTQPTGGQIQLSAKKLAALVPISNDLLDFSAGNSADTFVRNSLVRRIAVREDQAFLRDDGTNGTPKGIRYWAASANVTASNGTTTAQIEQDFTDLVQALEGSDVDMTNPVWFMAPRSKNNLLAKRDSAGGNLLYPELRTNNPTILGFPVFTTNSIPTNLGAGSNETELYLVNMSDTLIAEAGDMEIAVDTSASYLEGSTLVSSFTRDQTVIRAIIRHDFALVHAEAAAVKTGITW